MDRLPCEIINKILFVISHPVSDIFKIALEYAAEELRANGELDRRDNLQR